MNDTILRSVYEKANRLLQSGDKLFPEGFKQWSLVESPHESEGPIQPTGIDKLDRIAERFGGRIKYGSNAAANCIARSAVNYETKRVEPDNERHYIMLPDACQFTDMQTYAASLSHELIHWVETRQRDWNPGLSHFDQMLVNMGMMPPPLGYTIEELVAEMGAGLLLQECGGDPVVDARARYTAQYLSFIPEDEREAAYDSASARAREDVEWLMQFAQ